MLCGVPYFSEKSLLNFDPAPWVDQHFVASPVSTKTATCPDPSWEWAWQRWYIDMSGDVDESGWQYGFSFTMNNWHGKPVSLHSFVRRRRWIRKRKKKELRRDELPLVPESFTISSSYPIQRSSTQTRSSFEDDSSDFDLSEVTTIPALLRALQDSRIDREKLEALATFLASASIDEKVYVKNCKKDLLKNFVFEHSCRKANELLNASLTAAEASTSQVALRESPTPQD